MFNADWVISSAGTWEVETIFGSKISIPTFKEDQDPVALQKKELEYVNASTWIKDFMESGVYSFWDASADWFELSKTLYESESKNTYLSEWMKDPENERYKADNKLHSVENIYKVA